MKKVAVIYPNSDNINAIHYLQQNLERIFEEYIYVENYYLNELPAHMVIEADAFLVSNENMLYPLKNHIVNYNNVVVMNRSLSKKYLPAILNIPPNTDVLVVNDSYQSCVQTIYTFYELGISHLNFIPHDPHVAISEVDKNIKIAITPNEPHLIPPSIEEVINIGYREISFDTLLRLMGRLELDFELTNRNLIRHIRSITEANTDFHSNYLNNFLKSQMLNQIIRDSAQAILVVNADYGLEYSNDKANLIFDIADGTSAPLSDFISAPLMQIISGNDITQQLITINSDQYIIDKSSVMLMDQVVGYCITLQNEKELRDIEINLKKHLQKKGLYAKYRFHDIVYVSAAMKQCIDKAKKAAISNHTILIIGETGTGKELLAQSIHNYSQRSNAPFVAVNCAALPETLLESELFGYESGAFTGARKNGKLGLFEQANTGTIFLDEIGDISPNLQSRLLRVIQEKQIMRIGSDKIIDIDTRIITATNKNLEDEVRAGNFRSDLYYRLNVIPICIEPLRNRRDDILPLAKQFLGTIYEGITAEEKKLLTAYDWPGNVRQLESTTDYYKTLSAFPEFLSARKVIAEKSVESNTAVADGDRMVRHILRLIMESTEAFHGIGRTELAAQLRADNIKMGDGKLRELLSGMKARGLITIESGRRGTQITNLGIQYLR